jgi:hypothetical protein
MDSYEGNSQDPASLHKYLYCDANPGNNSDPSGHEIEDILTAMSIDNVIASPKGAQMTTRALPRRALTKGEINLATSIFGGAINYPVVTIRKWGYFGGRHRQLENTKRCYQNTFQMSEAPKPGIIMNKSCFALSCVCLFLISGCLLGDRVASETVTLTFSPKERQKTQGLLANDPIVQEVLGYLQTIMTSEGLSQQMPTTQPLEEGRIADFRGTSTVPILCKVYLRDNKLEILVMDTHFSHSRHNAEVSGICKRLSEKLENRYGTRRVRLGQTISRGFASM